MEWQSDKQVSGRKLFVLSILLSTRLWCMPNMCAAISKAECAVQPRAKSKGPTTMLKKVLYVM